MTKTNTGKNQIFRRKLQEESVDAIYSISFSPKTLSKIILRFSLNQREHSLVG